VTESDLRRELAADRLDEHPHDVLADLLAAIPYESDPQPYDELMAKELDDCTPLELLRRLVLTDECGELMHRFRACFHADGGAVEVIADLITKDEVAVAMEDIEREEREVAETEASLMPGRV
jgi:hypothetical protein